MRSVSSLWEVITSQFVKRERLTLVDAHPVLLRSSASTQKQECRVVTRLKNSTLGDRAELNTRVSLPRRFPRTNESISCRFSLPFDIVEL